MNSMLSTEVSMTKRASSFSQGIQVLIRGHVFLFVAASYFLASMLPQMLFKTIVVWPPAGVVMGAFLTFGLRAWQGVAAGSFISILYYFYGLEDESAWHWMNLTVNLATTFGNTAAGVLCWFLLAKDISRRKIFAGSRQLFLYFFPATAIYGVLTAVIGVGIYKVIGKPMLWGGASMSDAMLRWAISDMVAILVFTPPMVLWLQTGPIQIKTGESWHMGAVTLTLTSLILGMGIFSPFSKWLDYPLLQPVTLLLPLLWGTVRFPRLGGVVWNLMAFLALWWGTDMGYGAFVMDDREKAMDAMQVFAGLTSMAVLLLRASVLAEKRVGQRLARLAKTLEERVTQRTNHLQMEIVERQRVEADLRIAKEKAEEASHAKSLFLATMSHEIRTPLNGMLVQTQLLLDGVLSPSQRQRAESIRESGRILVTLLGDILDLSRIEAGGLELEEHNFQIDRILAQIITLMAPTAHSKGLNFKVDIPENVLDPLLGDAVRLRQILFNLVGNAVKFTQHGEIQVSVEFLKSEGAKKWFRFAVRDTGVGVPVKAKERIFALFSQADASISRRFGGVGLGLALCKRLIEAMGGEIDFASQVGRGSTFWITVAFGECRVEPVQEVPLSLPSLFLLLVEDDDFSRQVTTELLMSHGHRVMTAVSGQEALARIRAHAFDVVLMDLRMAGLDGAETVGNIRMMEDPRKAKVPVIALTADVTCEGRNLCRQVGMNGFLGKPLEIENFVSILHEVLFASMPAQSPSERDAGYSLLLDEAFLQRRYDDLGVKKMGVFVGMLPEQIHKRVSSLDASWSCRDLHALQDEIHALKGLAGVMGLIELVRVCQELGDKAEVGDESVLEDLISLVHSVANRSLEDMERFVASRVMIMESGLNQVAR